MVSEAMGSESQSMKQAPLSPYPPRRPLAADSGTPQAQPASQSAEPTLTPAKDLVPVPDVPGIEETDWIALDEDDRRKLAPILNKVQLAVTGKMQEVNELKRKAAAWDSAMSIPSVNDALHRYLEGRGPGADSASSENEAAAALEDLDPAKIKNLVTKTVKDSLQQAIAPLQQQLAGLFEVVAKRELDSQFLTLRERIPDIETYRDEITRMLAEDKARSVEDAYDMIKGRLSRTQRAKMPRTREATEEEVAQTAIVQESGPTSGRIIPNRSKGMLEHLRAAMREHNLRIT